MPDRVSQDNLPLAGIQVVAFEQAVAAPLCTRHLADLGAKVIKIERPGSGDFARDYDTAIHGLSTWFTWLNRSKRSVTLDLKHPKGQEIAHRLIARSDVVVQNFAPGSLDRLRLGVSQLHEKYPQLVVCSITGYGEEGPYRDKKAYDLLLQAEAGVLSITGTPESPAKCGVSLVDLSTGVYALSSVLAALYRRQLTGEGAAIRISLFDCIMEWMSAAALQANHGARPVRSGARHASIVPYGPYRVAGGRQVMLSVQNEREWLRFCQEVVCRPEWATDSRFATNELRLKNRGVLEPMIEEAFADASVEEIEARLAAASIAYSRMNDVAELFAHPQVVARQRLITVETPGGPVEVLRSPFDFEGVDECAGPVPAVGQHTHEVLREIGYSDDEISALSEDNVV